MKLYHIAGNSESGDDLSLFIRAESSAAAKAIWNGYHATDVEAGTAYMEMIREIVPSEIVSGAAGVVKNYPN